jgi:hypothetical protein
MASIRTVFDVRSGLFGAAIMSSLVWWINSSHGAWPATTAAAKQAAYTFLFGGLIMRLCSGLAQWRGSIALRITLATLIPSAITIVLVYAVHSLRGTPEPLLSTLPAGVLAPPSFAFFARRAALPLPIAAEVDLSAL